MRARAVVDGGIATTAQPKTSHGLAESRTAPYPFAWMGETDLDVRHKGSHTGHVRKHHEAAGDEQAQCKTVMH